MAHIKKIKSLQAPKLMQQAFCHKQMGVIDDEVSKYGCSKHGTTVLDVIEEINCHSKKFVITHFIRILFVLMDILGMPI